MFVLLFPTSAGTLCTKLKTMKTKILAFVSLTVFVLSSHNALSQGCSPDPSYSSEPSGFYPAGPLLINCSGVNATKTYVAFTDTAMANPVNPAQTIDAYIDAIRVDSVVGLPAGLSITTDVMSGATLESPYGVWLNTGSVPSQSPAVGCFGITGDPAAWQAALTGGPNNDGIFPISVFLDLRVALTIPDVSFLIPNGSWGSETGGLMEPLVDSLSLNLNVNGCNGALFVFPEVLADNSNTSNCDGSVDVEVYNGTPPFDYSFSNGVSGTSEIDTLCPGQYSVTVTDANGASIVTDFIVGSTATTFSNIGNNGWPPAGTDSLFSLYNTCDLDYSLPIDSFYITGALTVGTDTCLVDWVIWQAGEPYSLTSIYPFLGFDPTVFSLVLWCENGRAELGSFQVYEFLDLSVGVNDQLLEIEFSVSPNPSNGEYLIQLDDVGTNSLEVFDVNGSLILSKNISSQSFSLDIVDTSPGLYILKLQNEKGIGYRRLIKK